MVIIKVSLYKVVYVMIKEGPHTSGAFLYFNISSEENCDKEQSLYFRFNFSTMII